MWATAIGLPPNPVPQGPIHVAWRAAVSSRGDSGPVRGDSEEHPIRKLKSRLARWAFWGTGGTAVALIVVVGVGVLIPGCSVGYVTRQSFALCLPKTSSAAPGLRLRDLPSILPRRLFH